MEMNEVIDELVYKVDQLEHSCAEAHAIILELKEGKDNGKFRRTQFKPKDRQTAL
jgi:hypothetical protein